MLKQVNSYKAICKKYNKEKGKKWTEWLTLKEIFSKLGKQGIVGIMETDEKMSMVFKISQDINYVIEHEYLIMQSLNSLNSFCPHFCKSIGLIEGVVEPKVKLKSNPFEIKSKYGIKKKILLLEYIENSCKFYNYIRSKNIPEKILYSIIKQVLLAILIAQKKKKFTHYDLHSFNIMLKRCNEDLVFIYVIDDEHQFYVPTYGYYPVIIDYGFSYCKDIEDRPLWSSMGHTQVGFTSNQFNQLSDPKLFLVTVAGEMFEKRRSKDSKKLKRITNNLFSNLRIDWKSGWDDFDKISAADYLTNIFKKFKNYKKSKLFKIYDYYCIDIIQTLIILPFEKQNDNNIEKAYNAFINEWVKIEDNILNVYYNIYILKGIVNSARNVRADYMDNNFREYSIKKFKQDVLSVIDEVTEFCNPKNVNYEIMLCSLYILSTSIEGVYFDFMSKLNKRANVYKNKLPVDNIEEIVSILEVNIPNTYKANSNTKFLIFDVEKENTFSYDNLGEDEIYIINNMHNLKKGNYICNKIS